MLTAVVVLMELFLGLDGGAVLYVCMYPSVELVSLPG